MATKGYLFRAFHPQYYTTTEGIQPTDSTADITIKNHVERGGFRNPKRSQYISTTRNLHQALQWILNYKLDLAVIICDNLHSNVTLYDISQGNYGLTEKYKHCVRKHAEVLALPFINPQAIQIYSYDDLTRPFKNSLRQSLMTLEQQQSLIVNAIYNDLPGGSHCQEHGHNDDDCEKLHHWFAKEEDIERYYSSWCSYCRERDHNYDDCDKLHHWFAKEEDIERYYSSWCSYCSERGHNYDDCDKLHHWIATEEEIELYDSIWCSYCSERGHNDDDCEKLHHWITTEEEIELYNSFWWE